MAMDTPFFEHAANYSGHEAVPIPPLGDAEKVVDALVNLVFEPKAEAAVGAGSMIFSILDNLLPGPTESFMAKATQKAQLDDAPLAPPTAGSLSHPSPDGTGLHGKFLHK